MEKIEITVIGAGVVGLAIGWELSRGCKDIFILEKNTSFGGGISSRNSEVIHAGIYYPKSSLKAVTCVEGNKLLYQFCGENNIPFRKTGKLIVAVAEDEIKELEFLLRQGRENGVAGLELVPRAAIKKLQPQAEAAAALYSPETGILDSHSLMKSLADQFQARQGQIAYSTEVAGIAKTSGGFEVRVKDREQGELKFFTRLLINSSGLDADKIAGMAGLDKKEYRLKYCKGSYFRVAAAKAKQISLLIYPVPRKQGAGLGIHATPDLAGGLRLGPDDEYVDRLDYDVDPAKQDSFYQSAAKFLPFLRQEDLTPDMAGIRPKLQGPGEGFRDFIIQDESANGLPGLINLIGIESPGLTGALAIARRVKKIISGKDKADAYSKTVSPTFSRTTR